MMHIQKLSSAKFKKFSKQQGAVLLEAMIAIVIFSMGILALVGLQAAMLQNTTDSKFRADASYIAQQRLGVMWADPANAVAYVETNTNISSLLPGGKRTVTQTAPGSTQFTVTVGWTAPGETAVATAVAPCFMLTAHCFTTTANIAGG
jgi:type IV pilus assembly protein PilV